MSMPAVPTRTGDQLGSASAEYYRLGRRAVPVRLLVALITLGGAALRLLGLGSSSYWIDEIATLTQLRRGLSTLLFRYDSALPPLFPIMGHFWVGMFGTTEAATRTLAVLPSVAAIPALYALGRELFTPGVGLLSALLMSISQLQIFHAQDFRYYSLVVLLATLVLLFARKGLRSGRWQSVALGLYTLAAILLFYAHFLAVLVLVGVNLYVALSWVQHRHVQGQEGQGHRGVMDSAVVTRWLACQGLVLLGITPGLLAFLGELQAIGSLTKGGATSWIPDPPMTAPLSSLGSYIFSSDIFPETPLAILGALLLLLAPGALVYSRCLSTPERQVTAGAKLSAWRRTSKQAGPAAESAASSGSDAPVPDHREGALLVVCWIACPILLLFLISKLAEPVYIVRYTMGASPAMYLLVAFGIFLLRSLLARVLATTAILALTLPGLVAYYTAPNREQWRELAAYVQQNAAPRDVIIFAPSEAGALRDAFNWYYRGSIQECDIDLSLTDNEQMQTRLDQCTQGAQRFWLVLRTNADNNHARSAHLDNFFLVHPPAELTLLSQKEYRATPLYLFALGSKK